jgi:wobble nucleotide-excising tRNase
MGPRNAYKDMLDNVVSPITCVSMNHQNQLEQMENGAMFATISPFLVIYDNTSKASINLQKLTNLEPLTLSWMPTIIQNSP